MARKPPSLTAAAVRVKVSDKRVALKHLSGCATWQEESIAYCRSVPELRQAQTYVGNQLAKLVLGVGWLPPGAKEAVSLDGETVPPEIRALKDPAEAELARLTGEFGGQGTILGRMARNLDSVGETYLVGWAERPPTEENPGGVPESWQCCSIKEVAKKSGKWKVLDSPKDTQGRELTDDDTIIRIWEQDTTWVSEAACSMEGVLGEAKILQVLSQQVLAQAMRAASNGFLTLANELSDGPANPTEPEDGDEAVTDPFIETMDAIFLGPLEDPSDPASVQPGLLRGKGEWLHPNFLRHITFWSQEVDDALEKKIQARCTRIARGVNLPVEVIMGLDACVDHETEILTRRGWLTWEDVREGDETLTLNHVTGLSEWQTINLVSTFRAVNKPMVLLEGRSHSSLTTTNHRWPIVTQRGIRRWRDSEKLNTNCRIINAAPSGDLPTEAKYSDAFVELAAWFWTEGTNVATGSAVIYQSYVANPDKCDRIRATLTSLCGPAVPSLHESSRASGRAVCSFEDCGWPVHARGLCNAHRYQERIGIALRPVRRSAPMPAFVDLTRPAWSEKRAGGMANFRINKELAEQLRGVVEGKDKVVSHDFLRSLTQAQLELFIDRSVDGDGYRHASGYAQLHQSVEARRDAFTLACVLAGRAVHERDYVVGPSDRVAVEMLRYQTNVRRANPMRVGFGIEKTETMYSGVVWCPTLDNGTWLARRRGTVYFTGNTTYANAGQVDEDTFDDFLQPRADLMVEGITIGFLRPNLIDAGHNPDLVAQLGVTYDASALLAEPDKEKNAAAAMTAGVISDEAARRAWGFDDADAPTPLEKLTQLATMRGQVSAQLTVALLADLAAEAGMELPSAESLAPAVGTDIAATLANQLLAQHLASKKPAQRAVVAAVSRAKKPNYGAQLTAIDRDLRTRLHVAADGAMTVALRHAGNVLKSKAVSERNLLKNVKPELRFATLGPTKSAQFVTTDEAIDGSWDDLEVQFYAWGAAAQLDALETASRASGGFTVAQRESYAAHQAEDLDSAWQWFKASMSTAAATQLFDPSPVVQLGEFDPTLKVPVGMVRQALARAGGATGLTTSGEGRGIWLALADGGTRPAGGIGTGELLRDAMRDHGVTVEAYEWQWGGARTPFPPHQNLDGQRFGNWDDAVLVNPDGWPGTFCIPGDHSGCSCDAAPILISAEEARAAGIDPDNPLGITDDFDEGA